MSDPKKDIKDLLNLDDESLKNLKKEIEGEADLGDFTFVDPQEGETVVGTLTQEEADIAYELSALSEKFAGIQQTVIESLSQRVNRLRQSAKKVDRDKFTLFTQTHCVMYVMTEAEENEVTRAMMIIPMLKANLFYDLAERLGIHKQFIGLRSKGRVTVWGRRASTIVVG